jgi:hypothetical protein
MAIAGTALSQVSPVGAIGPFAPCSTVYQMAKLDKKITVASTHPSARQPNAMGLLRCCDC